MQETIPIDILLKIVEKIGVKSISSSGTSIVVSRDKLVVEVNKYKDIENLRGLELRSTNKLIYEIVKSLDLEYNIDDYKRKIKDIWD